MCSKCTFEDPGLLAELESLLQADGPAATEPAVNKKRKVESVTETTETHETTCTASQLTMAVPLM